MSIEIKTLSMAKKILKDTYLYNLKQCKTKDEKKYLIAKYEHSYDCLKILKKYDNARFKNYAIAMLLHDIGRFFEYKKYKNFEHSYYGYKYLKKYYTQNPHILLPIKYHEKDLEWKAELSKDKEFLSINLNGRNELQIGCLYVREIDVISNMKYILKNKIHDRNCMINDELVSNVDLGKLAEKDQIKNDADEIIYILCGLNIFETQQGKRYLKKYKIIKKMLNKLEQLIDEKDRKKYEKIVDIIKTRYYF